jgi:SnoaL-like domain
MDIDARLGIEWQIQRELVRYVRLNDAQRWPELAAMFVEDGRLVRPSAPQAMLHGRAAILASFHARPADRRMHHVCANLQVEVSSPQAARAMSTYLIFGGSVADPAALPVLDAGPPVICAFEDELVLTADGWRFAARIGRMLFQSPRG